MNSHASPLHALPRAGRIAGMERTLHSNLPSCPPTDPSSAWAPYLPSGRGVGGWENGFRWEEECGTQGLA